MGTIDGGRRKTVVANWKMCGSSAPLAQLPAIGAAALVHPGIDVVVCPPTALIAAAVNQRGGCLIGAQDSHEAVAGAFTGSTSPALLRAIGVSHVILGHSERRSALGESDALVRAKAATAIAAGLAAIVCVGESADGHARGATHSIIARQLAGSIPPEATAETLLVAYEPIWAIGTGRTPTVAQVTAVHEGIRHVLADLLGADAARRIRILYGGSVNADNAAALLDPHDVDGVLVGNASLAANTFVPILKNIALVHPMPDPSRSG